MNIKELLLFAKKQSASDLHLISNSAPHLRINGDITPIRINALDKKEVGDMILSIMTEEQRAYYTQHMEIDFAISLGAELRFRVNAFTTLYGPAAVFRDIPMEIRSIKELKLPNILERFACLSKGLILVTGPAGSGKSTTLAAMIDFINDNLSKHIITIEDPIEFIHRSKRSIINQREVGTHTRSDSRALKSALREDPDVILIGEMRDISTIRLALTAAETGHLVFSTLHTSSAAMAIDRIIDVFPQEDKSLARTMLSSSLEAVITQLLIKTSDGRKRMAANEILVANAAVRNLIRDNKIPQISSMMQVGAKYGMKSMKDALAHLVDERSITMEEMNKALNNLQEEGQTSSF